MGKKRFNLDDNFNDVNTYIETPKETPVQVQPGKAEEPQQEQMVPKKSYKEPDKKFRRNITLSEEQFRCLEYIKKNKNNTRVQGEGLITIDKIMFDMIQYSIDNQYPKEKAMTEKILKLKELEEFGDLI